MPPPMSPPNPGGGLPERPAEFLVLLSGGLDSLLALRLLEREGARLECVHFVTGFNHGRYRTAVDSGLEAGTLPPTHVRDITSEYQRHVAEAVAREGRDPCVACRSLMLRRAADLAQERGIGVLVTGEVVGQRVRGQCHADLLRIEHAAGVEGRVLRPLSAAFLDPAPLADGGLVQRRLLDRLRVQGRIQGRSRRGQFDLARRLSLPVHPIPSGGCCRLTDPRFVRRLQDEIQHRDDGPLEPAELALLALGRHFRLGSSAKAIVARDERESALLSSAAGSRWTFQVESGRGAVGLLLGDPVAIGFEELGSLAVRYSAERHGGPVRVAFRGPRQRRVVMSRPAADDYLSALRV